MRNPIGAKIAHRNKCLDPIPVFRVFLPGFSRYFCNVQSETKIYRFHFIDIRLTYGLLITLLGGIIGVLPIGLLNDRYLHSTSSEWVVFVVYVCVWLVLLAYFVTKLLVSRNKEEKIVFGAEGVDSKLFGTISYQGIDTYEVLKGLSFINLDKPSPSLFLRLKDGGRIRFDLNVKYYDEEIDTYMAFLDDFVERMEASKRTVTSQGNVSTLQAWPYQTASRPANRSSYINPKKTFQHTEARAQIEKAKKRKQSGKKWVIPASLVFGILVFSRTCGDGLVKWLRPDPLQTLRKEVSTRHAERQDELRQAIRDEGEVYLLGPGVAGNTKPILVPNSDKQATTDLAILTLMETNDAINDFIRNKDSLGYGLYLWSDSLHFPQIRYPARQSGSADRKLYFFLYDEHAAMSPYFRIGIQRRQVAAPFTVMWEVVYDHPDELLAKMVKSPGYTNLVDLVFLLNQYEDVKFYMASSRFHGHTHEEFEAAAAVVLQAIRSEGLDTEGFAIQEYDTGLIESR